MKNYSHYYCFLSFFVLLLHLTMREFFTWNSHHRQTAYNKINNLQKNITSCEAMNGWFPVDNSLGSLSY